MIYINLFNISSDQKTIQVSIETSVGKNITSVKLLTDKTYANKVYEDLSYKLTKISNKEVFTISIKEAKVSSFDGIFFLEIISNDIVTTTECVTCRNPVTAVTANFRIIKEYILNSILSIDTCDISNTKHKSCSNGDTSDIITSNLLLNGVTTALSLGYNDEAIDIYNTINKLYLTDGKCNSCDTFSNNTSLIGLGYGTLNNTLILG